jgi:hypothetical protein
MLLCWASKDTENERNFLVKNVYPKLREFFNSEYGVDFQVKLCFLYSEQSLIMFNRINSIGYRLEMGSDRISNK